MNTTNAKRGMIIMAVAVSVLATAFSLNLWPFGRKAKAKVNKYKFGSAVTDLYVDTSSFDVRVLPAEGGVCTVTCYESDILRHSVDFKSGKLSIVQEKVTGSYAAVNIRLEIEIRLPAADRASLEIKTTSGDIEVSSGLMFDDVRLTSYSGDISTETHVRYKLKCGTTAGELYMGNTFPDIVEANTTSGDIKGMGMRGTEMDLQSVSGDIELTDIIASESLAIKSTSGDIIFSGCDASVIYIKSTSGDIEGSLLSGKTFTAKTTSGSIDVPASSGTQTCEIRTVSGDIRVFVE
ncbi:MAG: DUF4097 family beta strand repeat protein [Oscillospiraceae bacterium]|nr:DUF4097 family beta strand repeat protein [Oscillospiraceae bacterium]